MPLAKSILHPSAVEDLRSHKLKRLVPRPNSYFMDIKCPGCYKIKTVFSHVQENVKCDGCLIVLCRPTGGKGKLSDDLTASSFTLRLKHGTMKVQD